MMKKLALGVATAAVLLSAAPAMAQVGFYAGDRGVGVEIGPPAGAYYDYDGCGPYGCRDYYDYGGPSVVVRDGWHRHHYWHEHYR